MDLIVDQTGSGCTASLYLDGSSTAVATHTNTDIEARTKPAQFQLMDYDVHHMYTSELYVADFDTRDTRPVKQVPDASGNYSAWVGGYGEFGDDDIMSAANAAAGGDKVSVNVEAYPGPTAVSIDAVVLKTVCAVGSTGPSNIAPFVRIASTDYTAGNVNPDVYPSPSLVEYVTNPNTAVAWVEADLDTTEIGLEAKT